MIIIAPKAFILLNHIGASATIRRFQSNGHNSILSNVYFFCCNGRKTKSTKSIPQRQNPQKHPPNNPPLSHFTPRKSNIKQPKSLQENPEALSIQGFFSATLLFHFHLFFFFFFLKDLITPSQKNECSSTPRSHQPPQSPGLRQCSLRRRRSIPFFLHQRFLGSSPTHVSQHTAASRI